MPDIDIIIKTVNKNPRVFKDVGDDIDRLDKTAGNVASRGIGQLQTALGVGLKIAAGAAVIAIGALGVALGKSFMAAVDMEQAVADIMAVMGKAAPPVEELNKAIQGLGLDPKLKVSAFEAADAIEMLAKNGITWQEIQDGMARSTILLANATNDDFALAADVATDAMVQFNKDASEMADVVDGIIGVTQQSKFDINDYALAIAQAGGVAGSVGVDFEDFNAMLAATSSSFASGSDAGTSFKVFLQQLIPDTNKSADAMRALGLFSGLTGAEFQKLQGDMQDTMVAIADLDPTSKNYAERLKELNIKLGEQRSQLNAGESAFFTAEGSMKSAEEITAALSTAFDGLSDAERIAAASTIFGTDAMRTALALADAGEDTVHKFKLAIGDTSAEDAAATRMDTLRGKWEIFLGVTETLSIQLGNVFLPIARDVVEWATQLATTHGPKVIEWFTGLTTSAASFIALLREGKDPLTAFRDAFKDFIPPATMDAIVKIVGNIQSVIDVVGKTLAPFVSWNDVLAGLAIALGIAAVTAIGSFLIAIAPAALVVGGITLAVALLGDAFAPVLTTIGAFGTDALKEIVDWATGNETEFTATKKIWEEFRDAVVEVGTNIQTAFFGPDGAGTKLAKWLSVTFPEAVTDTTKAMDVLSSSWAIMNQEVGGTLTTTQRDFTKFVDALKMAMDAGLGLMLLKTASSLSNLGLSFAAFGAATTGNWDAMWLALNKIQENEQAVQAAQLEFNLKGMYAVMTAGGEDVVEGFGLGVDRGNHFAVGAVRGMGDAVKKDFSDNLEIESPSGVFLGYGTNTIQGFVDGVNGMIGAVGTKMGEVVSAVKNLFADPINWLYQKGVDAVQGFINGIGGMIGAAQAKVTELGTLAAQALGLTLQEDSPSRVFHRHGENAGQGFINGMNSKLEQARQAAASLAQVASTAVAAVAGKVQAEDGSWGSPSFYGKVQASDGTWVSPSFYTSPATGRIPVANPAPPATPALTYAQQSTALYQSQYGTTVQSPATIAAIQAQIAALNAAAPLITNVADGIQEVLAHFWKFGEILGASSKRLNILDSLEAAVDAGVKEQMARAKSAGMKLAEDGTYVPASFYATTQAAATQVAAAVQSMAGFVRSGDGWLVPPSFYGAVQSIASNVRDFTNNPAFTTGNTSPGDLKFPTSFSTLMDNIQYMVATGDFPGKSANLPYYEDSKLMDLVLTFSQAIRQFGNSTSAASQGLTDIIQGKLPIQSWDTWLKAMQLQLGSQGAQVGLQLGKQILDYVQVSLGIHSPSKKFAWIGEMSAKGFTQGFERGMSNTPTSINNSRTTSNHMVVNVNSTGDAVRDIRNQVELYALTFGATS